MSKKRKIIRYYKKKLWGRGLVARALDFVFLRAILFTACYLWFALHLTNTVLRVLMSALALGFVCVAIELGKSIRLERFIKKERAHMREAYMKSKVLAMEDDAFESALSESLKALAEDVPGENLTVFRKSTALCADDLLFAVRSAVKHDMDTLYIFSLSPLNEKALAFCADFGLTVRDVSRQLLPLIAANAGFETDDETLERIQLEKLKEKQKRQPGIDMFAASRTRKYVLVALALFALSFFARYALYYRMMAGACLSFAAASFWMNHFSSQEANQ